MDSKAYRRFQLIFCSASDCLALVSSISRVCQCIDNNDTAKTTNIRRVHPSVIRASSPTLESQMVTSHVFLASGAQEDLPPPSSQGNYINVLQMPQPSANSFNAAGRIFQGSGSASTTSVFNPMTMSTPNPRLINPNNGDRA